MGTSFSRAEVDQYVNAARREERDRGATELNNALARVQSQFQQDLEKQYDANLEREREHQKVITRLEQQEKNCSSLVESLRSNLAEKQQQLVIFDQRVRRLETQVLEEQHVSASRKRRAEQLEDDIQRVTKELESKKAEQKEALAKISALELVINATTKDLDFERQRLKSAKEKIMNMEKQLRAFCTTTEEIKHVFDKQQEKLEAMHKALQEKENVQINASTEVDPNQIVEYNVVRETETTSHTSNGTMEPNSTSSVEREPNIVGADLACSDDEYVTETHDRV